MLATTCKGKFLWKTASPNDPRFRAFAENPDVISERLPLASTELVDVLQRALHLDPSCRLSLQQLREQVAKIPLFKKEKKGFFAKFFSVND
ncbi:hypothetical protein D9758_006108 [Tetrapyrgos nigripes]|uniref:Uncharacterized protein n=1 Tax=Tetrapyrgos nigripes TaxID=182062 RepID=A0A8H5DAK1_9AGAR|nr:hypothetical protein D9758_006108 [Tetrapyrgos nigripes]